MKACVIEKPMKYSIQDISTPEIKDDEVLLRITVAGICTNDIRDYKGSNYTYPRVGGHEYAGVIEKMGKDVDTNLFHVGQKATNYIIENCGCCYECKHHAENLCGAAANGPTFYKKDGTSGYFGFAQYKAVKASHLNVFPDDADARVIAFTEPLSCVINSINKTNIQLGDTVVVIGGGVMGLMHVMCAVKQGANVIVSETQEARRKLALELGAKAVIDPMNEDPVEKVKELTNGQMAQVVFNTTAIAAVADQAIQMTGKRGTVVMFSSIHPNTPVPVDLGRVHSNEIRIQGSVSTTATSFAQAVDCLTNGIIDITPLMDKMFEYTDVTEAMEYACRPDTYKVLIHFSD